MPTRTALIALTMALSGSAAGQQPPGDGIPPALVGAVRQIQPPEKPGAWVVQILSRGGLDGRGTGDLAISSDGVLTLFKEGGTAASVPSDVLGSLHQFVQTSSTWTAMSLLGICSDCVATLIVLTRRQPDGLLETHSVFWDTTTRASVAADVLRIHDLAMALQPK